MTYGCKDFLLRQKLRKILVLMSIQDSQASQRKQASSPLNAATSGWKSFPETGPLVIADSFLTAHCSTFDALVAAEKAAAQGSAPLFVTPTRRERGCLVTEGCTVLFLPYDHACRDRKIRFAVFGRELAELEQIIRKARREKEHAQKPSLRDADPVSVGEILKPIGTRDEWYSEMLEGRM